jgi:hypothetical protein
LLSRAGADYVEPMAGLRETLDRLVTVFAAQIIAVLRDAPLDEVLALTARSVPVQNGGETTATAAPTRRPRAKKTAKKAAPLQTDPMAVAAAERFFAERGTKGATEPQLHEALAAQGFAASNGAAGVIPMLVERAIIRDAGFRRTTGKGTAPVYVVSPLKS